MSGPGKASFAVLAAAAAAAAGLAGAFNFTHKRHPPSPRSRSSMDSEQDRACTARIHSGMEWIAAQHAEPVSIQSFDGLTLRGLYLPAQNPRCCALLFHGYRSRGLREFSLLAPFYHSQGISMLIPDQRACGESDGTYITFGVLERRDAADWAAYMDRRLGGKTPMILQGVSLGASTVMMAADLPLPPSVGGIVADCGFTSPWDIIAHCAKQWYHLPPFPILSLLSQLARHRLGFSYRDCSTLDSLAHSQLPLLLIHGGKDNFVPIHMTEENFLAAAGWKRKLIVPEAGHAASYLVDEAACQRELLAFLNHILQEEPPWQKNV